MEKAYCNRCKENAEKAGHFHLDNTDTRRCDYCEDELIDVVEYFAKNFFWKGREIEDYQLEFDGEPKVGAQIVGLWLRCGERSQYIRVALETIEAAVEDGLKGIETVTKQYVGSRYHFRSLLQSGKIATIKFVKATAENDDLREMHCELLNSSNYTPSKNPNPRKKSKSANFVQPVFDLEKKAVRSFDLRNLIYCQIDGKEIAGQYLI